MVLSVGIIGDNPQQPSIVAETYIPDQLIAGNLKLVTDNITLSGAVALPRGTVVGFARFGTGALTSSTGKTQATGTLTVASVPLDGATVTVQGTVFTFNTQLPGNVSQNPAPNQILITPGMTTAQVAQALVEALAAATDANTTKMTYSLSGSVITATAVQVGTGGNALTLASSSGAVTVSGGTLSGGTANTGTATIGTISAGRNVQPGNYVITLTSATQGNVIDPLGEMLGVTTMGTAFVNSQINFTITTGGSPAAGDAFYINVANVGASGIWKLCTNGAVDGSEIPGGILVDFSDPSAGNVAAGVYLMGEFNGNAIVFDSSITPAYIKDAFRGKGIFIKSSVSAFDPT